MSFSKIRISLFWKILVWFWLSFIVIFMTNLLIMQRHGDDVRYRKLPPHLHKQLINGKRKLEHVVAKQGLSKFSRRMKRFDRSYILNEKGDDIFDQNVPSLLAELNHKVITEQRILSAVKKEQLYFGGLPLQVEGKSYRYYIGQKIPFWSRSFFGQFMREFSHNLLLTSFMVSFPLSLLLAWIITSPINRLRRTTKKLSLDLNDTKPLNRLTRRRDEFGHLAEDFKGLILHINQLIESKSQLLSDVSHELRSPLARLQIALGLARKKWSDIDQKENSSELERIHKEADNINQMLTNLLDYARIDSSTLERQQSICDLQQLLQSVVEDARFEGANKGLSIELDVQTNSRLMGEPNELLSAFENTLRNAIRYANNDIQITLSRTTLASYPDQEFAYISICDDGEGVDESKIGKLLDAFYRPNEDRARKSGGVGLGLSIVKKVAERHQGQLQLRNLEHGGFCVELFFPITA